MKTFVHKRHLIATALAFGLGIASSGALADRDSILVTVLPDQAVPGAIRIVDARGAVVVENEDYQGRDTEIAENTVGGRVNRLQALGANK